MAAARRSHVLTLLGGMIVLAWAVLWWLDRSPYGGYLHQHGSTPAHHHHGPGPLTGAVLFVAGWVLMTIAMMLPSTLPLVEIFRRLTRRRPDSRRLVGMMVAGYLASWTVFGVLVFFLIRGLATLVEGWHWLDANTWAVAASLFVLAGAFQFSSLKYECLDRCRSPLGFVTAHWSGRRDCQRAFLLGAHHGLFCVGCCWALMMLMFAAGTASLAWMLVLGVLMALEKNMPWGRRMGQPLGAALLTAGVVLVAWNVMLPGIHPG